jgi:hypothetical protein
MKALNGGSRQPFATSKPWEVGDASDGFLFAVFETIPEAASPPTSVCSAQCSRALVGASQHMQPSTRPWHIPDTHNAQNRHMCKCSNVSAAIHTALPPTQHAQDLASCLVLRHPPWKTTGNAPAHTSESVAAQIAI